MEQSYRPPHYVFIAFAVLGIIAILYFGIDRKPEVTSSPIPSPSATPLALEDDWDIAEKEVDQGLVTIGCQNDSTLYGMGKCISKQLEYLENEINQVELKFKETAKMANGIIE